VIAHALFSLATTVVGWTYAGYPLALALVARLRPQPRIRHPLQMRVSVIIPAHNEASAIDTKVANVSASHYPSSALELIVVSDGSTDGTPQAARDAGADTVLDLPRVGKAAALSRAAEVATGEIFAFTDADSRFAPDTLSQLVSNFADRSVGGVSANQLFAAEGDAIGHGEGLYWRYDQWIKRLEDRVGSTVSAGGGLYAVRRGLFRAPQLAAGTDDFLISTEIVRAGFRLAFDEHCRVYLRPSESGRAELRRKVRVMNRGQRAAFSLGRLLIPGLGGWYGFQLLSHQVLRRFVPFFLLLALASSIWLVVGNPLWWIVLAPQLLFYALACVGAIGAGRAWSRRRLLWVPYFFCLANLAAALAMLSLLAGKRYERWTPARSALPARVT
jgi:cellulose synthase/poly-beta-1,6-N-acetylglucosamine synthase-like glycosyltransferase